MEETPKPLSLGELLRFKREENNLSLAEVARILRIKEEIIRQIEKDEKPTIPTTYLKGYLRAYAKLLMLPEFENHLQNLKMSDERNCMNGWKVFASHKQVSANHKFIQWITFCIISGLLLLVTLWWKCDNLLNFNSNSHVVSDNDN